MRTITLKGLMGALVLASIGLVVSACNTTKATIDTFAKFTSSTSPGEMYQRRWLREARAKRRVCLPLSRSRILNRTSHVGNGEYLTSLSVLLKVPAGEQDEFRTLSQSEYPLLFAPDRRTAESLLATLTSKRED